MISGLLIPLSMLSTAFDATRFYAPLVAALALFVAVRAWMDAVPFLYAHLCIGVLACLLLISYLAPSIPSSETHAIRFNGLLGFLIGLGLLAATACRSPAPEQITRVVAWSGAILAGHALAEGRYVNGRLEAIGYNPNYLGILLALSLVAATGRALRTRNPAWLGSAVLCLAAIIQTASRGALVAAAAGLASLVLRRRPVAVQMLAGLAVPATAWLFPGSLRLLEGLAASERGTDELLNNTEMRSQVAEFAVGVALDHPLRGIGFAGFETYAAESPEFGVYMGTHNDYLRLAAESGIPALAAFAVLIWAGLKQNRPELAVVRALCVCQLTGLLFANALGNIAHSTPFWLILGCLLAASAQAHPLPPQLTTHPTADPTAGTPPLDATLTSHQKAGTRVDQ